jgi:hypothetical protein
MPRDALLKSREAAAAMAWDFLLIFHATVTRE